MKMITNDIENNNSNRGNNNNNNNVNRNISHSHSIIMNHISSLVSSRQQRKEAILYLIIFILLSLLISNNTLIRTDSDSNSNRIMTTTTTTDYNKLLIPSAAAFIVVDDYHNNDNNNNLISASASSFNDNDIDDSDTDRKDTTTTTNGAEQSRDDHIYIPSYLEQYVIDHGIEIGFDSHNVNLTSPSLSCQLINNKSASPIYNEIHTYIKELELYNEFVIDFQPITDIRKQLLNGMKHDQICPLLQPPTIMTSDIATTSTATRSVKSSSTLDSIFVNSTMTYNNTNRTLLSYSSTHGYIEPLLPPLRHLSLCYAKQRNKVLMRLDYMIHDFSIMCNKIKLHSRIILIDMGASLSFHGKENGTQPATYLTSLYTKFGFHFDHIYAYEITKKDPNEVYKLVPESLIPAYHWINIGVSADINSSSNPLRIILNKYTIDDFIIIKLDIDTPMIELQLVNQLLNDDNYHHQFIDQFYFEHHVQLQELIKNWRNKVNGTVLESLQLFQSLRKKGIPTHYWP